MSIMEEKARILKEAYNKAYSQHGDLTEDNKGEKILIPTVLGSGRTGAPFEMYYYFLNDMKYFTLSTDSTINHQKIFIELVRFPNGKINRHLFYSILPDTTYPFNSTLLTFNIGENGIRIQNNIIIQEINLTSSNKKDELASIIRSGNNLFSYLFNTDFFENNITLTNGTNSQILKLNRIEVNHDFSLESENQCKFILPVKGNVDIKQGNPNKLVCKYYLNGQINGVYNKLSFKRNGYKMSEYIGQEKREERGLLNPHTEICGIALGDPENMGSRYMWIIIVVVVFIVLVIVGLIFWYKKNQKEQNNGSAGDPLLENNTLSKSNNLDRASNLAEVFKGIGDMLSMGGV